MFGVNVSDLQEGVKIKGREISGESKYVESIEQFDLEKGHHFLVLHITDEAAEADSIKVSMDPTQGTVGTLDETGVVVLQMKDNKSQKVKVEIVKGAESRVVYYNIDGLTFKRKNN